MKDRKELTDDGGRERRTDLVKLSVGEGGVHWVQGNGDHYDFMGRKVSISPEGISFNRGKDRVNISWAQIEGRKPVEAPARHLANVIKRGRRG